ncbi:6680_t:CDS:2 [Gigaspora margarita]|uniref:6680_t:CDS:1 n=1 Tax=Gigaspora margarita TaxID=4874 RepID=A0ABM8W5D3_GIGMA|nr:6680_t:CDS:2 [Gigaspora margarita]
MDILEVDMNMIAATENRQTDDPSQKIHKESREVGETTKTPKNQNDMTSSGDPGLPKKEKQETSESGPAIKIDKQGMNKANLVWSDENLSDITVQPVLDPDEQQRINMYETQSNATVEDDNSKLVAQKSYSQAVTGSVSYTCVRKDTVTTTNIEITNDDVTIMGSHQLTKIENIKPFECNPLEPLKIMTHNVRGINNALKFQLFLEHSMRERAHIVAITETKLPQSISSTHAIINPLYKIYIANFMKLQQAGLTSLMNFYNITESTWLGCGSESQIDDFWVSRGMLVLLTEPELAPVENITDSDHKIVSTELALLHLLKNKQRKRIKHKRYLYDRMSDED